MAGCRNAWSGYPLGSQLDADVTTRFTDETFHTSDTAGNGMFVFAPDLLLQGFRYRSQNVVLSTVDV